MDGPFVSLCGWFIIIALPCYGIYYTIKQHNEKKRIEKKKKARKKEIAEFRKTYKSPLDDN
jgi:hypothetical protein